MGIEIDVSGIQDFQDKIAFLNGIQRDLFFRESCMEGANRLVALVKPRTPAKTGNLRREWDNAFGRLSREGVSMSKGGRNVYSATIENTATSSEGVQYASYVEHGHRQTPGRYVPAIKKRLKASWVEGQHMLEISEGELKNILPGVIRTKLDVMIRTVIPHD